MLRTLLIFISALLTAQVSWSDAIGNYQRISQSIPKMEIKADEQSQAWARSARHVLTITNESIAETLLAMNEEAAKQGRPFFCVPQTQHLDAQNLGQLIAEASNNLKSNSATVSQIAFAAVVKKYPCQSEAREAQSFLTQTHAAMQHSERTS